ncbi:sensor histidine kinase [Marinomonas sp. MED121]|uniref:CHASE domain-containing sensor histidine kinase n=1 Tax=Marinomonas sp. MED121 TaxID=314277 RepID=UPI000068FF04|nr:CHASE domain-containing protein [Marinomonas sp. MED121]EAQ67043.1 sensor histidine kinase [Marinomonas sp. MED121]
MSEKRFKGRFKKDGKLQWYHWLVVILSLVLTLSAWQVTLKLANQKSQIQFDFQTDLLIELVKERMQKYEDALWAGVAAIHAQEKPINTNTWHAFATALSIEEKYPGINGIGVIDYVSPENLTAYLAEQRKLRPDYKIHPKHTNPGYWPITHIEPVQQNQKAVGLDMAHESNRYQASMMARDTAKAQITGPIILVQDEKQTPGFLFFAPYYDEVNPPQTLTSRRRTFVANVYAPFIMEKLMMGTLKNENRLVNFSIKDGQSLLYDELQPEALGFDQDPLFSKVVKVNMYGRQWLFQLQSTRLFRHQVTNNQPKMILIGGICIDLMLLALFLILSRSNKNAISYANHVTKKLRVSENKLQTTIDSMRDALITIDKNNTILSFNKAAEAILGFQEQDLIGKNITALPDPSLEGPDETNHYLNVKNKSAYEEKKIINIASKEGGLLPIDLTITKASSGAINYFIALIRDLSNEVRIEKALETSEALLDTAVNASPTGFAILNLNGEFIELNKSMSRWLEYDKDELLGRHFELILEGQSKPIIRSMIQNMLEQKQTSIHIENQYIQKDGSLVWGLLTGALVLDKNQVIANIVLHIVDIQKEKVLLQNLIQQNKALEKSNADLEQFAYVASHDLRSPLNGIQQLAQWIEEDCRELLPSDSKAHLNLMMGRSGRMIKLLDDLLKYSRVSRYDYKYEAIELKTLVNDQFALIDSPDGFSYKSSNSLLLVPRVPFEIVVRNILSNAIKHHDKNTGVIEVTFNKSESFQIITITDDGPGIPPEMQNKVLEMFQTLKARDDVEGSGMGLAMTKRIINHYKGDLAIDSDGVRGTSFIISWPLPGQS